MSWTVDRLLADLQRQGVLVTAQEGRLRLSAPKGVLTPALLKTLEAAKPALLAALAAAAPLEALAPLAPVARDGRLPLSFDQERLWFLQQLNPASPVLNLAIAFRFRRPVDPGLLQRTLEEIVRRHEALRTTFDSTGGEPVQVIHDPGEARLEQVDLRGLEAQAAEAGARRWVADQVARPFDLARGPLARFALLLMPAGGDIEVAILDHTIADHSSGDVLYAEQAALYEAFAEGRPSPLAELPIQYADYAHWQRHWMRGDVLERQLAYWRPQLAGLPPVDLPTDRPRPAVQTQGGALLSSGMPAALSRGLAALAAGERSTLFMLLLAGFYALLWRRSGKQDVSVGTPVGNRFAPELEGVIGSFVNNLVLRCDLSGNPTFRELLGRVRRVVLDGVAHQDLPFQKLVEALQPARDLSRPPLFQILFDFNVEQQETWMRARRGGVTVDRHLVEFDLGVHVAAGPDGGLCSHWGYNTDLFDVGTIERLAREYERLLAAAVERPDSRLRDLVALPEAERQLVVVEWNRTSVELPPQTVHGLIAAQARRAPGAVAVTAADGRLTYRELLARAGGLAARLRRAGAAPEKLVGICLGRSARLAESVLAVLQTGAAYVPLDPGLPTSRLAYMLADSGASVVITEQGLVELLPSGPQLVVLDREGDGLAGSAGAGDDSDGVQGEPGNLAYVLYTSGSTGRPKGVQIEHRSVVNFLSAMGRLRSVASGDVLLAVSSLSFDISVLELLLPLSVGARVAVASQDTARDGVRLLGELRQVGATVMQGTPATWQLLLEALERDQGASAGLPIRALCGGEALPRRLAQRMRERLAGVTHLYGPTEATVWATAHEVAATDGPIPIGKPLDNVRVYVLDGELAPLPVGVPGAVYIGGECLARGYWNRPSSTAERFVPDPFADGVRLYRTGDLGRWLADGTLEFLGRDDLQVKVRGFRVELGEIEAALAEHPGIRQAAVAAVAGSAGEVVLVAYVVPLARPGPKVDELLAYLGERLPEYMLPAAWRQLEALPLTTNGKLDRAALPGPDMRRPDVGAGYAPPGTAVEEALAGLWKEVLGVERVGVDDNFFDLGGHSLRMARLQTRVRETFAREVTLLEMFQAPSVRAMARRLEHGRETAAPSFVEARRRAEQAHEALERQRRPVG